MAHILHTSLGTRREDDKDLCLHVPQNAKTRKGFMFSKLKQNKQTKTLILHLVLESSSEHSNENVKVFAARLTGKRSLSSEHQSIDTTTPLCCAHRLCALA